MRGRYQYRRCFIDLQVTFNEVFGKVHPMYCGWDHIDPNTMGYTLIAKKIIQTIEAEEFYEARKGGKFRMFDKKLISKIKNVATCNDAIIKRVRETLQYRVKIGFTKITN